MIAIYLSMIDTPEERVDFETLFRTYKGKLFSVAYGILGNYHNAEEAVSQAFFTVAKNFSKVSPLGRAEREAYLKIVIRNAAIDIYRHEKRDNSTAFEDIEDLEAVSDDVSDAVLSEMSYNGIVEAIRSLPEGYAEPLYLFHVRGLSIKEISAVLYEQEETVKKRLQRARRKLRAVLSEQGITVSEEQDHV